MCARAIYYRFFVFRICVGGMIVLEKIYVILNIFKLYSVSVYIFDACPFHLFLLKCHSHFVQTFLPFVFVFCVCCLPWKKLNHNNNVLIYYLCVSGVACGHVQFNACICEHSTTIFLFFSFRKCIVIDTIHSSV